MTEYIGIKGLKNFLTELVYGHYTKPGEKHSSPAWKTISDYKELEFIERDLKTHHNDILKLEEYQEIKLTHLLDLLEKIRYTFNSILSTFIKVKSRAHRSLNQIGSGKIRKTDLGKFSRAVMDLEQYFGTRHMRNYDTILQCLALLLNISNRLIKKITEYEGKISEKEPEIQATINKHVERLYDKDSQDYVRLQLIAGIKSDNTETLRLENSNFLYFKGVYIEMSKLYKDFVELNDNVLLNLKRMKTESQLQNSHAFETVGEMGIEALEKQKEIVTTIINHINELIRLEEIQIEKERIHASQDIIKDKPSLTEVHPELGRHVPKVLSIPSDMIDSELVDEDIARIQKDQNERLNRLYSIHISRWFEEQYDRYPIVKIKIQKELKIKLGKMQSETLSDDELNYKKNNEFKKIILGKALEQIKKDPKSLKELKSISNSTEEITRKTKLKDLMVEELRKPTNEKVKEFLEEVQTEMLKFLKAAHSKKNRDKLTQFFIRCCEVNKIKFDLNTNHGAIAQIVLLWYPGNIRFWNTFGFVRPKRFEILNIRYIQLMNEISGMKIEKESFGKSLKYNGLDFAADHAA